MPLEAAERAAAEEGMVTGTMTTMQGVTEANLAAEATALWMAADVAARLLTVVLLAMASSRGGASAVAAGRGRMMRG